MASRRRERHLRDARRRRARPPRRRLLAVCEGECTEPQYLTGLVLHLRNVTVDLDISNEHGDPRRLVERAKEVRTRMEREARRQRDPNLRYDEVWCVFDRDEHPRFVQAIDMARANGIHVAASNPCFELWLLLHFRDSPGARHRHDVQKMLRDSIPGYDKHLDFSQVVQGLAEATTRATRLDADAERMGEAGRNPTTGVYRLTDSIARRDDA